VADILGELEQQGTPIDGLGWCKQELDALLEQMEPEPIDPDTLRGLDERKPKIVTCPHCNEEFDVNEHDQA